MKVGVRQIVMAVLAEMKKEKTRMVRLWNKDVSTEYMQRDPVYGVVFLFSLYSSSLPSRSALSPAALPLLSGKGAAYQLTRETRVGDTLKTRFLGVYTTRVYLHSLAGMPVWAAASLATNWPLVV